MSASAQHDTGHFSYHHKCLIKTPASACTNTTACTSTLGWVPVGSVSSKRIAHRQFRPHLPLCTASLVFPAEVAEELRLFENTHTKERRQFPSRVTATTCLDSGETIQRYAVTEQAPCVVRLEKGKYSYSGNKGIFLFKSLLSLAKSSVCITGLPSLTCQYFP